MSLKTKAIYGFSWSMFEGIFGQGILFIVGIILARLLDPRDFGLIGIITAFLGISSYIIEGGLKSALIRKTDATSADYNTVFISNVCMGVFLYFLLFLFSGSIATFYDEAILKSLFRYIGIILVFNSLSIIQQTLLIKKLDFKTQGIIAITASVFAGILSVAMAFLGYGIWSLVALSVTKPLLSTILYWSMGHWKPSWIFSKKSFKELFDFGYKLLVADLLNTIYSNIYYLLIGKYFSTQSLGYYTRAQQFQTPISSNIALGIRRISYPIMSTVQDDIERLRGIFIKFVRFSAFLNFTILLALAAVAKPLILILIGPKWETSIFYLQLLCIPGMLYPLQSLNLNLLMVKGYSNRTLKLEVIKKIILIPLVFVTVLFSIEVMLYGLILFAMIELFINSYYTKQIIGVSIFGQLKEIWPFLMVGLVNFLFMFSINFLDGLSIVESFLLQLVVGAITIILLNEFFKFPEYLEIKRKLFDLFNKIVKRAQ